MRTDHIRRAPTGHRVGEGHHNAKLSDDDVRLIRELRQPQDGTAGLTYKAIAGKFECSIPTVRDICKFWTRTDV